MKKIFSLLFLSVALLSVIAIKAEQTVDERWNQATEAYANGQYQVAESIFCQLCDEGFQNAALYYNLGNCYFQQNQIGKAILNYKRASLSDPSDKDIQYNLELARSKTKDKIEQVPTFFLKEWVDNIRDLLNTDQWAKFAIAFLILDFLMVMAWLLAKVLWLRKTGFYLSILFSLLFIISIINGLSSASHTYNSDEAIVISSATLIKSSPSENGKDLFMVHEGTCMTIKQSLEGWNEVELLDGNKGWIKSETIEKIIK